MGLADNGIARGVEESDLEGTLSLQSHSIWLHFALLPRMASNG